MSNYCHIAMKYVHNYCHIAMKYVHNYCHIAMKYVTASKDTKCARGEAADQVFMHTTELNAITTSHCSVIDCSTLLWSGFKFERSAIIIITFDRFPTLHS